MKRGQPASTSLTIHDVAAAAGVSAKTVSRVINRQPNVRDELREIRATIDRYKPDIVFNVLEEFRGEAVYDLNVIAFLELLVQFLQAYVFVLLNAMYISGALADEH